MQIKLITGLLLSSLLLSCNYHNDESTGYAAIVDINVSENYGENYTVKSGDSLYYIAWHFGIDYKKLAAMNNIKEPYSISVGQNLRLVDQPSKPTILPSNKVVKKVVPNKAVPKKYVSNKATPKKIENISWSWPISPSTMRKDSFTGGSQRGLDIDAKANTKVKAAGTGKVIYVGNGIKGMRNLIIIKHSNDFITAYGNNKTLYVKEGQSVKAGQLISSLGDSSKNKTHLHFEMRKHGKPVNPIKYLPKFS